MVFLWQFTALAPDEPIAVQEGISQNPHQGQGNYILSLPTQVKYEGLLLTAPLEGPEGGFIPAVRNTLPFWTQL